MHRDSIVWRQDADVLDTFLAVLLHTNGVKIEELTLVMPIRLSLYDTVLQRKLAETATLEQYRRKDWRGLHTHLRRYRSLQKLTVQVPEVECPISFTFDEQIVIAWVRNFIQAELMEWIQRGVAQVHIRVSPHACSSPHSHNYRMPQ